MKSSWQVETGRLACHWFEVGQHADYKAPWMQGVSGIQGSYLPPLPDFADHSPFGGANWFQRYTADSDSD
jgi:hypothetical protein